MSANTLPYAPRSAQVAALLDPTIEAMTLDRDDSIRCLYDCGRPIPDIALACDCTDADIMRALEADTYCKGCGRLCDREERVDSFTHEFGTQMLYSTVSDCCEDTCINRYGQEV